MNHLTDLQLQAVADGEIGGPEAESLLAHCGGCDRCRRELDGIRRVPAARAAGRGDEAPDPVWPRLAAARSSRRPLRVGPVLAAGAVAACAAGVALGLFVGRTPDKAAGAEGTLLWTDTAGASLLDIFETGFDPADGKDAS